MATTDGENLRAVFKAYDVRGTVPDQIDEVLAERVGAAFVAVTEGERVVVGHDMRPSSPGMAQAFARGANRAGADAVLIGLCSTDGLYFASGHLGLPGVMFTASHNPAQYNGIKMCRAERRADRARHRPRRHPRPRRGRRRARRPDAPGTTTEQDLLDAYAAHLLDARARHRPPAQGRRRRRQRHGRPDRAGRARQARPRRRGDVLRARRHRSPTTRPTRSTRPRWRPAGARPRRSAPTSGWRSTATPTAASWSTSAASWSTRPR